MQHFVNDLDDVVTDGLDGFIHGAGADRLQRLDGYPDIKVVVRADAPGTNVAVVSGGGAGHEPAHTGFVGPGLLSAAVSGEIFASPSVEAVLAGIVAVTGDAGCLLVVKNYTGDRLNFGLAAERAKAQGLNVRMVVVGDDIALPEALQPRGLAGTLLVHKVAGAGALQGASLDEVHADAEQVAGLVRTFGVSLSTASIPGRSSRERLGDDQAELGLGIHGEPGVEVVPLTSARHVVARVAARLIATLPPASPLALLVNNLGGVAAIEMSVLLRDLLETDLGRRAEILIGPAPLMTSLDMRGFSVTAVPLDDRLRAALQAPVAPWTAWPGTRRLGPIRVRAVPPTVRRSRSEPSQDEPTRARLTAMCEALIREREALDLLDAKVGDGDTGSTAAHAAQKILDALDGLPLADLGALLADVSDLLASAMGGSSGVLLSILLSSAAAAVRNGATTVAALAEGAETMQRYGGAGEGDRTMLDALLPALRALGDGGSLAAAAQAARAGAERTATMTCALAGRSAAVPSSHLDGVVDPGAEAVAVVFSALDSR